MRLSESLQAWGTADFAATLKRELAAHTDELPLQQALSGTNAVVEEAITVVLLDAHADDAAIHVKVGVFFAGILAGCSCTDDPTPIDSQTEYGEWLITIDRQSGAARIEQVED